MNSNAILFRDLGLEIITTLAPRTLALTLTGGRGVRGLMLGMFGAEWAVRGRPSQVNGQLTSYLEQSPLPFTVAGQGSFV